MVIDHVAEDEHFRDHHTPRLYGLQSYISMPIILPNGAFFGTLCAIDPRPARLNRPEVIGMFKNFAQLIAFHLDAQERAAKQDAALLDAQEGVKLREQFVAILAHDLRNPLASIDAGVSLLLRRRADEKTIRDIGSHIRGSVRRMRGLIDDMLDFAKARLGSGSTLDRNPNAPLRDHLEQVIGELWHWSLRTSPGRLHGPDDRRADRTVTGWLPASSYKATFRRPAGAARRADRSTR